MGTMTGDSDGNTFPTYFLSFTTQPAPASSNSTALQVANFSVVAQSLPAGATISYKWQANTGAGFADINNGAVYGNTTTANVAVINSTGLNNASFRVNISAAGTGNTTSNPALLTVTT